MIKAIQHLWKENPSFRYAISFFVVGLLMLLYSFSNPNTQSNTNTQNPSITRHQNQQGQSSAGNSFSIFKIF
ncbi:membrane or secreted protein [Candidatus Magnetomorum sp. HK-1]|nr:membrane or secreted protein [Candidatus Magnetomorum sp. HK-1]